LTEKVLSHDELLKANTIARNLVLSKKKKDQAILGLIAVLPRKPKRPVYYVYDLHLPHLPYYTRDAVRYLGDYIDLLVKYYALDKTGNKKCESSSLGGNLERLKDKIDTVLWSQLKDFEENIYTPAKHVFKVVDRRHRFTAKEVVYTVFIATILGETIKKESKLAKDVADDKIYDN
jgi:hypothetical protein